jgi:cyanophycin synthetase
VPKQETCRTVEGAVAAARRIGFPVVVKPLDGNHGRGVGLDLMSDDDVRAAFVVAQEESRRGWIIVESFITGKDYRCLIVGGRMQAIAERVPAHVVGDGTHTVEELVRITNADPRRGVGHEKVLTRIKVDDAAIELVREQGFAMDSMCRRAGVTMVKLALTGNMSTGGISDGPDLRGAPGQRRDRGGGRADDRPGRRGNRLHLPGHHPAGARDRWARSAR